MLAIYKLLLMLSILEMPLFFLFYFLVFLLEGFVQKKYIQGWGSHHCMLTGTVEAKKSGKKDRNMCPLMVCGPFELQFRKTSATCNLNLKALILLWGSILLPVVDRAKDNTFG